MNRRAAALCLRNHLHDLRQERVRPHPLRTYDDRTSTIDRRANDRVAHRFLYWNRLTCDHRFVDRATALYHDAVHGYLFPGADAQSVSGLYEIQRHVGFGPVVGDAARRFWRQAEQGPNRGAGTIARPKLEHLAQEYERDDDGRGLEIHVYTARCIAKRIRKNARHGGGDHTVDVGDSHAQCDEREHVQVASDERLPPTDEEWPAAP